MFAGHSGGGMQAASQGPYGPESGLPGALFCSCIRARIAHRSLANHGKGSTPGCSSEEVGHLRNGLLSLVATSCRTDRYSLAILSPTVKLSPQPM